MIYIAFLAALVLLAVGLLLLVGVARKRRGLGILAGERVSRDTSETPGPLLVAETVPLRGKPDYLIRQDGFLIPVEIKTAERAPAQAYQNHVAQLYAYCLLVEEHYGIRPPYGVIRYLDRTTLAVLKEERLAYPAGTEEHLRALVTEMMTKKQVGRTVSGPVDPERLCRRCLADGRCTQ